MMRYENQCCDCSVPGYPCRGVDCDLRHVPVYYCDKCKEEIPEDVYEVDGKEICEYCLKRLFLKKDVITL